MLMLYNKIDCFCSIIFYAIKNKKRNYFNYLEIGISELIPVSLVYEVLIY